MAQHKVIDLPPADEVDPTYVEALEDAGAPKALVEWMKDQTKPEDPEADHSEAE
ncbi:hypothetical protein [Streptomyces sp. NPDC002676]